MACLAFGGVRFTSSSMKPQLENAVSQRGCNQGLGSWMGSELFSGTQEQITESPWALAFKRRWSYLLHRAVEVFK